MKKLLFLLIFIPQIVFSQVLINLSPDSTLYDLHVLVTSAVPGSPSYFAPGLAWPNGADTITNDSIYEEPSYLKWLTEGRIYRLHHNFKPTKLSNLEIHLSGGDGITSNYYGVSEWLDQSSNNNDATQSTQADRPYYGGNRLNGVPAITPDGTNDVLDLASEINMNDFTMFLVLEVSVANDHILGHSTEVQNLLRLSTINCRLKINATDVDFTISTTADYHILEITRDNSDDINVWVDGGASSSNPQSNADLWTVNQIFDTVSGFGANDVLELIVYSEEKSSGDRTTVREYLEDKYGL